MITDWQSTSLVHVCSWQATLTTATLLCGVADGVTWRLQSVLHAAAWLITCIRRYEHIITPALHDILHWLHSASPLELCWKCLTVLAADVRSTLIMCVLMYTAAAPARLRSTDHGDLVVIPCMWSTGFDCCSFYVCRPPIWNKLPQDLWSADTREQFKCRLKNWLFECASYRHWLKARHINGLTYLSWHTMLHILCVCDSCYRHSPNPQPNWTLPPVPKGMYF